MESPRTADVSLREKEIAREDEKGEEEEEEKKRNKRQERRDGVKRPERVEEVSFHTQRGERAFLRSRPERVTLFRGKAEFGIYRQTNVSLSTSRPDNGPRSVHVVAAAATSRKKGK